MTSSTDWIYVEDALPTEGRDVDIAIENSLARWVECGGSYYPEGERYLGLEGSYWRGADGKILVFRVYAWRPVTKAPPRRERPRLAGL